MSAREELFAGYRPNAKKDDREAETRALLATKSQLQSELGRFNAAQAKLEESSSTIFGIHSEYLDFRVSLKKAGEAVVALRRRIESDDRWIWWSFLYFMTVVAWVVSRRIGLVWVLSWFMRFTTSFMGAVVPRWSSDAVVGNAAHSSEVTALSSSIPPASYQPSLSQSAILNSTLLLVPSDLAEPSTSPSSSQASAKVPTPFAPEQPGPTTRLPPPKDRRREKRNREL